MDVKHGIQINRAVHVREQICGRSTGRRRAIEGRLPLQVRGEMRGINHEKHESSLSFVKFFSDWQDLRRSRSVDETFGVQTRRDVLAFFLRVEPRGAGGDVKNIFQGST